jgi:TPR repeat protein
MRQMTPARPDSALRFLKALLAAAAFATAPLTAAAAPQPAEPLSDSVPLTPALQARVDAAVAHYEAGRLAQAARDFGWLAQRAVPAAQFNLGVMHLRGELPGASRSEAERWLLLAARGGFVTAMFTLGRALEGGALGRRDLGAAHDWYEAAAERGSVDAAVAMGTAFYLGRGRTRDAAAAAHWYREAAKGGDIGAQYLIASMYESGEGVAQDLRLALHWYRAAARQGDDAAPAKVREIEQRMGEKPAVNP